MIIIYFAGHSHEMSRLIFPEKIIECQPLQLLLDAKFNAKIKKITYYIHVNVFFALTDPEF